MGKSQFKIAADLVVDDCIANGHRYPGASDYYWAYVNLFTEFNYSFDLTKFNDYILKRM